MSNSLLSTRRTVSVPFRYGLAVFSVPIALTATYLLQPYSFRAPLFFLAIMVSTWVGGIGPGLLAVLLSATSVLVVLNPDGAVPTRFHSVPNVVAFLATSLLVGYWSDVRRRAEDALRQSFDELEARVQERTADIQRSNEQLQFEIAERTRAEEGLRKSEQVLREVERLSQTGSWEYDAATGEIFATEGYLRNCFGDDRSKGKRPEDFLEAIHPDDRDRAMERWKQLLALGSPQDFEYRVVWPDGSVHILSIFAIVVYNESGQPSRVYGTSMDTTDRKRTEEALQEREELMRVLTENANDFIRLHDIEGRSIYASPSVERLYGRQPKTMFEFAHPEDLPACQRWWEQVVAGGSERLHWRVHDSDGNWRWLETSASRFPYKGQPHVLTVCRDITERKQAVETLRESERKLEEAQRIAHVGHWERDITTNFITWSDELYRIFGLPPQESGFPLSQWREMIHREDRERIDESIQAAKRGLRFYDVEARIVRPDGEVRFIHNQGEFVHDEQGQPLRAFGIAQDITERRRAEEQLRRAEEQARQVLDTIPEQIWSGPADGTLDYCNYPWRAYTGLGLEDIQGDGWQRMIHPDDRERVLKAWYESMAAGKLYEQEERHRRYDGDYRWFLCRGVPLRDAEGRIERWYGANTDIEDRKRAEEELHRDKEVLHKIFDNVPVALSFFDADGRMVLMNREWERTFGWSLEEINDTDVDLFREVYPDPQERRRALDFLAASTGEWADFTIRTRDKRVRDITWASIRLSDRTKIIVYLPLI